jgi:hypothetical protein
VGITSVYTSAVWALADIQSLSKLSLETAMKLFDLKTVPILTFGLDILWERHGEDNLKASENMKVTYLRKP